MQVRDISWKLLDSLRKQCDMPWVVFGDFNEITHLDEKLGWMERDAGQMREFRECLKNYGLTNLGFVGQRYMWCNGRLGEHRTLIRLDRMVANEEWRVLFLEAKVHHVSMFASDHYLLVLWLERKVRSRSLKRRFLFETIWSRDERCMQVVEEAWDPLRVNPDFQIHDRLRNCQACLQRWNREVFENVNKVLKVRQECLQHLEALNMLHETTNEIENLRKEINEVLM